MVKKLAVVISGAVSLGSYEAGVTYEILEAIAQHNEKTNNERIEIDVITGASAGGITATILAKSLIYHGKLMREAYDNPLYRTWVQDVKMLRKNISDDPGLLEDLSREQHKKSLLNTALLDNIAKSALPSDLSPSKDISESPHPAVNPESRQILVGISMSNLNGFPISIPLEKNESEDFKYSQYKDRFVFALTRLDNLNDKQALIEWEEYDSIGNKATWRGRTGEESNPSWNKIREIALSSGAFPFAFETRQIERFSDQDSNPEALYSTRDSNHKKERMSEGETPIADWTKG